MNRKIIFATTLLVVLLLAISIVRDKSIKTEEAGGTEAKLVMKDVSPRETQINNYLSRPDIFPPISLDGRLLRAVWYPGSDGKSKVQNHPTSSFPSRAGVLVFEGDQLIWESKEGIYDITPSSVYFRDVTGDGIGELFVLSTSGEMDEICFLFIYQWQRNTFNLISPSYGLTHKGETQMGSSVNGCVGPESKGGVLQDIDGDGTMEIITLGFFGENKNEATKQIYKLKGTQYKLWKKEIVMLSPADELFYATRSLSKDEKYVYYNNKIIPGADPRTFVPLPNPIKNWRGETLWSGFGKDAVRVYKDGDVLEGADPNTFVVLNYTYAKDKNHVYKYGKVILFYDRYGKVASSSYDAESFDVFSSTPYVKDKNGVYIEIDPLLPNPYPILEADLETFRALDDQYAVDRNHVYRRENVVDGADPNTFIYVKDPYNSHTFYKDTNYVFYRGDIVEGADPRTFVPLDTSTGKDSSRVYFELQELRGADPNTFQVIGESYEDYAKDKNYVYFFNYAGPFVIDGADPETFTVLEGTDQYALDKTSVFHEAKKVEGVDPLTFRYFGQSTSWPSYIADATHVFVEDQMIPGADPGTFQPIKGWYSKDKNHVYENTKILEGADPATFSPP